MVRAFAAALVLHDEGAAGNAQQRVVRGKQILVAEERLVGRDERDAVRVGKLDKLRLGGDFVGEAVALKLDVEAIAELGSLKFVSPEYMQSVPITYGLRQTTAGVRGVSPEYAIMRTETAEFGRFINHEDVENHRRVAFLGYEVARRLFSNIPPVGETIRINGVAFEVVGVMPNKAQISNYFYPDKLSVFYGPDVAVSAGNAASHYELSNGLKFDIDARWTATLVRKDGRWLVGAFHYSANVFRNPIMEKQRRFLVMAGGGVAILLGVIGFILGRRRVVRPA